ncbi:MAG TPA: FecR family protein [Polyangiaceae bacterium]|nr:FecR family protein [Polyangiaceae bacterium]
MARPLTPLGSLGEKVAESFEQEKAARQLAIARAERMFLTATRLPAASRSKQRTWAWSLLAACLALVLVGFAVLRPRQQLAFTVDGSTGRAQTWLAAPAARSVLVEFSDGTRLVVEPLSRARVVDTGAHGASIALENGSLSANVVHTSHSAWQLIAGPFAVRVTGTRFDLRWDSASQRFSITVQEGSVGVAGSIVGAERAVRAGETLVASVAESRFDLINGAQRLAGQAGGAAAAPPIDGPAFGDPALAPGAPRQAAQAAQAGAEPSRVEAPSKDAAGGWRELAKQGDLRQAFAAADAHGFQSVCDSATPAELLLLGDAARVSGRADRATEALFTLRRRFPRDPRRAAAAFALGKVAFDQRHAYAQAAEWFSTCVREQPNGPLVREAWGRQIEALRNSGDGAGAQRTAREYLARYPDGPHADVARSVLK